MVDRSTIRLTQYSHGAGCGCKLSPKVLSEILHGQATNRAMFPALLVGNDTRDDAAVLDLGNGTGLVSTTDFFMPIVDDPYHFGCIASANAISDVYAMGGTPVLAIGILGWPIEKLSPDIAAEVVRGSRDTCQQAGIPLAGGHSIDTPEPLYGLAVSGLVDLRHLKHNSTAQPGDVVILTKPLGIGIITTAHKRGIAQQEHLEQAITWMETLNRIGAEFGRLACVTAMTDVTGYGLLGHLCEIAQASKVQIRIDYSAVPQLPNIEHYIAQGAIPGGTLRNWLSYGESVVLNNESYSQRNNSEALRARFEQHKSILAVLCDPQTSGGLAVCYSPSNAAFEAIGSVLAEHGLSAQVQPIAHCTAHREGEPYIIIDNVL